MNMSQKQAIAYGRRHGVKWYVVNSGGGLLGGCVTHEQAVRMRDQLQAYYRDDPWNSDMTVDIIKAEEWGK